MANYNAYKHDDGTPRPAVTSILGSLFDKPELYHWFKRISAQKAVELCSGGVEGREEMIVKEAIAECDKVRDSAGDMGSRIHQIIECLLQGKSVDLDQVEPEVKRRVEMWIEWSKGHTLEPVHLEETLLTDSYAGTGDFFGKLDGKMVYIDWKSSNHANTDVMPLQCGAYVKAYEEKYGVTIEDMGVCHISPDGLKMYWYGDVKQESFDAWDAALHLWAWRNRNSKKWKSITKEIV